MQSTSTSIPTINQEKMIDELKLELEIENINSKLVPYKYAIKDNYLCRVHIKNGEIKYEKLSNFIAIITEEIYEDDGTSKELVSYKVHGLNLFTMKPFPVISISPENFNSGNWFQKNWGVGAIVEPGVQIKDKVKHAIQLLSLDSKGQTLFTHFGWKHIKLGWIYLHAGGAVGSNDISVKIEKEEEKLKYYTLSKTNDSLKDAANLSLKFLTLADESVTFPLLALVVLAPLCEIFNQTGKMPKFTMWLFGQSGERKSSVASCMLNFFGSFPDGDNYPANFQDTYNNIEKKAHILKDNLLVVDDFLPTATIKERNAMEQTAQKLLRGYGDRSGKGRMAYDTSLQKTYTPRGLCLVTGEDVPTAGISTAARYYLIEMKGIDLHALTEFQEKSHLARQTMIHYIEWLSTRFESKIKEFDFLFKRLRKDFSSLIQEGRFMDTTIWLYIGFITYLEFLHESNVINLKNLQKLEDKCKTVLLQTGKFNKDQLVESDPVKQFIVALNSLISAKKVTLLDKKYSPTEQTKNFIGWEDAHYYYLLLDEAMASVINYYSRLRQAFPITISALARMLIKNAYTISDSNSGTTHRAYVGGKQRRITKLVKSTIEELDIE